jgi:hypothetical protein
MTKRNDVRYDGSSMAFLFHDCYGLLLEQSEIIHTMHLDFVYIQFMLLRYLVDTNSMLYVSRLN